MKTLPSRIQHLATTDINAVPIARLVEKWRRRAKALGPLASGNVSIATCAKELEKLLPKRSLAIAELERLRPGARVTHSIFYGGTFVRHGSGSLVINFDHHGEKELQLSFTAGKLAKGAKREKARPAKRSALRKEIDDATWKLNIGKRPYVARRGAKKP